MAHAAPDHTHDGQTGHHGVAHHLPFWLLVAVFAALLVLTFVTVTAIKIDFGRMTNLWIALTIATIKAALVILYFMHLKYERPFNAVILISTFLFVALFIGFALLDSLQYQPNITELRQADKDYPRAYAPEVFDAGKTP